MKPGTPIDYIKLRQYKRIASEVIHDGGNITEMARRAGVSSAFISRYLRKHAPHLHSKLKEAKSRRVIAPEVILYRLKVIKASKSQAAAARKLCLTGNAITYTLKTYAPDGLDDAIDLYEESYGAPLFEVAA
jgi:DNA-binding phage protein